MALRSREYISHSLGAPLMRRTGRKNNSFCFRVQNQARRSTIFPVGRIVPRIYQILTRNEHNLSIMQAITANKAATSDSTLQAQIAALRESLKNQRARARQMWDSCAPETTEEESRAALGKFTEQLLKGQKDEAYG